MNLMSEYINQLRSLAAALIGGSLYLSERQRLFTQLIAADDSKNLVCDSVTRKKIDLAKDCSSQQRLTAESIQVAKKIYYCNNNSLNVPGNGFIDRCKSILSDGQAANIDIPSELREFILS